MPKGFGRVLPGRGFHPAETRGEPSIGDRWTAGTQAGLGPGGWTESRPRPTLRPGRGGAARALFGPHRNWAASAAAQAAFGKLAAGRARHQAEMAK